MMSLRYVPHEQSHTEEGRRVDRCNELCMKDPTGVCTLCEALVLSQDDFFCSYRQPKKPSDLGSSAKIVCDKMNLTMH